MKLALVVVAVFLNAATCMMSPMGEFMRVYRNIKESSFLDVIMSDEALFMKMYEKADLKNCLSLIYYGLVLKNFKFQLSDPKVAEILSRASRLLYHRSYQTWFGFRECAFVDRALFHKYFVDNAHLLPGDDNYFYQINNLMLQGIIESESQVFDWCSSTLETEPDKHTVIPHTDDNVFAMMLIFHTPNHFLEGLVEDWKARVGKKCHYVNFGSLLDKIKGMKSTDGRLEAFVDWLKTKSKVSPFQFQLFHRHGHLRALFKKAVKMHAWKMVNKILYMLAPTAEIIDFMSLVPREHFGDIKLEHNIPVHRYFPILVVARFKFRDCGTAGILL